jgi:hypothetical protein
MVGSTAAGLRDADYDFNPPRHPKSKYLEVDARHENTPDMVKGGYGRLAEVTLEPRLKAIPTFAPPAIPANSSPWN